jgi:type IV secretory pathway VirJ component
VTITAAALALAAAIVLAGCGSGYTRVREIKAAPDGFVNKEVRLQGTAARSSEPGRANAYLLRDGSGEIMVVTKGELPAPDTEVAVRGIVRSVVSRGVGWSLELRVEETERLR